MQAVFRPAVVVGEVAEGKNGGGGGGEGVVVDGKAVQVVAAILVLAATEGEVVVLVRVRAGV